jgi:hypothetical protein
MTRINPKENGKHRLTQREIRFVKELSKGSTQTEAAQQAGYSLRNPAQSGHQALNNIRMKMPEVLDYYGLSDRALIEKHLVPALKAKKTHFFQRGGKVTDTRSVPDYTARLEALRLTLQLREKSTPIKREQDTGVKVIMVDVPRPEPPVGPKVVKPEAAQTPVDTQRNLPPKS